MTHQTILILAIIVLAIICLIIYGYKFGSNKGWLWVKYPQAGTFTVVATKNVANEILDGDKKPRGIFQSLWLKLGIYWIGFFSSILEFPWETRSIKMDGKVLTGVDEPKINPHQTYLPKRFPIAGLNSFAVRNGIARFIFNLHCSVSKDKEGLVIQNARTVPQWQEMILSIIFSTTENFLKNKTVQEVTNLDIATDEPGKLKNELLKHTALINTIYGVTIDAIDLKYDEEANIEQTAAATRVATAQYAGDEKVAIADGERRAKEVEKLTAILQLEITRLQNDGKEDLAKKLVVALGKDYGTYAMAEAIKETNAHTVVLQTDKAVVPVSTS